MHADTHTMRVLRWDWAFVYRGGHTRENCEEAKGRRGNDRGSIGPVPLFQPRGYPAWSVLFEPTLQECGAILVNMMNFVNIN